MWGQPFIISMHWESSFVCFLGLLLWSQCKFFAMWGACCKKRSGQTWAGVGWLAGQFGRFAKLLRAVDTEIALQHLFFFLNSVRVLRQSERVHPRSKPGRLETLLVQDNKAGLYPFKKIGLAWNLEPLSHSFVSSSDQIQLLENFESNVWVLCSLQKLKFAHRVLADFFQTKAREKNPQLRNCA